MPTFDYQGRFGQQLREGNIDARDRRAALNAVRHMGIVPLSVNESQGSSVALASRTAKRTMAPSRSFSGNAKIRSRDITALTRQLATLTNSGFALARALTFIQNQAENEGVRQIVDDINTAVRSGSSLSDAMEHHPRHFNDLYINMIKAGETGGILALLLERLAAMREADEELLGKIKGALTYPAVMMLAMLISLVILFAFVVPKFVLMFAEMGQSLPTPTLIMIMISAVFEQYWWAIAGVIATLVVSTRLWRQTPAGRLAIDYLTLRLPVLGKFATQVAMSRLCRTQGTLLDSGVNLIAALEASRGVAGNIVIATAISNSLIKIREGNKVGQTFAATGLFPTLVTEMISLGEESGQVAPMMLKVADVYSRQTDELVKALTSILEPVMILFMGGIVGLVVVAMLMPIFSMNLMG